MADVLPDELDGVVHSILSDNSAATYMDGVWYGSLMGLEGFRGYWFKSYEDIDFSFDISDGAVARMLQRPKSWKALIITFHPAERFIS